MREARCQEELRRAGELGGVNAERDAEIRRALAEERRKLAEALSMTERVAEIVRAMEPRFGAIDRELGQQQARPVHHSPAPQSSGWQQQNVTDSPNEGGFFVA